MIPEIGVQVNVLRNSFRLEQSGMRELLKGPVMQDLTRRAIRVQAAAKRNATGLGAGPRVRTGRLRNSISFRQGIDGRSPYVDIGSAVRYAAYVELGHRNRAHAYPLVTPGGKQVMVNGRMAFGYVSDKPTRPYPYLRPALDAAR